MQTLEQRRRSNQLIASINVTGFVSIMVVLLYIVMGPYTLVIDARRPAVDLPKTNHPVMMRGAAREDAIMISVEWDEIVWFGNERVELSQLPAKIQNAIKNGSPPTVYLKVDGRARTRDVNKVLDAVHTTGLEKIAFLVEPRKN
jgi:biopolymer transport protein ExbD